MKLKYMALSDANIKAEVKNILKRYYWYKDELEKINAKDNITIDDEENKMIYETYIYYIKESFSQSVNEAYKDKVWQFMYHKASIEDYEKVLVKKDIQRWIFTLAESLGYLNNKKEDV